MIRRDRPSAAAALLGIAAVLVALGARGYKKTVPSIGRIPWLLVILLVTGSCATYRSADLKEPA
ncbi:MAG: hypothetical protein KDD47_08140, partial [Acidobacteria bacterium]|nr:hypothetical protein [Acidobacteriota bacterium]